MSSTARAVRAAAVSLPVRLVCCPALTTTWMRAMTSSLWSGSLGCVLGHCSSCGGSSCHLTCSRWPRGRRLVVGGDLTESMSWCEQAQWFVVGWFCFVMIMLVALTMSR